MKLDQKFQCHKGLLGSAATLFLFFELFTGAELGWSTSCGCLLGSSGLRSRGHIRLNLSGHHLKGLVNILALLGRGLKEADRVMICHLLALLEGDGTFVFQIALVSYKDSSDVVLSVLFNFTHPGVDSVEGVAVSNVIDNNDAVGALVITGCDRLESLLASSVPNLQLADLLVNIDGTNLEVDTNGGHEVLLKVVILETNK